MLWSYLNSHPDILCLRGVFGSTNKINFGKFYGELPEECHSSELISLRNEKPIEFLENYVWKEYSKPFKAIGFKYFYNHDRHLSRRESVINYFKANAGIKFLHLKRENLLATLFSYKRALAQEQWSKNNTDFRTHISIKECSDYFQNILDNQKRMDDLFADRTLQVDYDNLINSANQTHQEILDYIGVKLSSLTSGTNRNRETVLLESIINFNELKSYFINTEYAKYFH